MFTFDILLASYGRSELLRKCLDSINQTKLDSMSKIIVLTHREDTETALIIKELSEFLPIEVIKVDQKHPPGASRNILIQNSKADYLFFLDDDATVEKGYFELVSSLVEKLNPDVLGGPDISNNLETSQNVLGIVLKSGFVMGPTAKRHFSDNAEAYEVDETNLTLCNLWVKRSIFGDQKFKFSEKLNRCEENLFLEELRQNFFKLFFSPQIPVRHHRRTSFKDLALIQFQSGYFRGIVFHLNRGTRKSLFVLPILTGVYLILMPLMPEGPTFILILIHSLFSWIISLEVLGMTKKIRYFFLSWAYIIIIHVFFSIGLVFGTIKGFFVKYEQL